MILKPKKNWRCMKTWMISHRGLCGWEETNMKWNIHKGTRVRQIAYWWRNYSIWHLVSLGTAFISLITDGSENENTINIIRFNYGLVVEPKSWFYPKNKLNIFVKQIRKQSVQSVQRLRSSRWCLDLIVFCNLSIYTHIWALSSENGPHQVHVKWIKM